MNREVQYTETISKKLKKFKANFPVIDGFKKKIKELETFPDPFKYGHQLHGKWKGFNEEHITGSFVFIFRWLPQQNLIQYVDLDDHKVLFGRDNRS